MDLRIFWPRRRLGVVLAAVAVVAVGMSYTIWWGPVVLHRSFWIVPGDIWGTFRDAHIIGWGGEGILYASNIQPLTGFISFPGMPVLLAPVAMVSGNLGLTESLPVTLFHPSAWLLLGPVEMAVGATVLFPLDALALRIGVPRRRRMALIWAEAALLWPVIAMWGHPEDLLAVGLSIYGLMAAFDARWRRAALLLGIALTFQPLVVLLLPLAFAVAPLRRLASIAGIAVAPSLGLLAAPLVHAWRTTTQLLLNQPTYPGVNHPTPWLPFSRVLAHAGGTPSALLERTGTHGFTLHTTVARLGPVVAGGPVRLIPLGLALVAALVVRRWRPAEQTIWFVGALSLGLRCVFEAVMTPYYAVPALALALVVAAALSWQRVAIAMLAAFLCTYLGYRHAGAWSYYLPVTLTLLWTVACGWHSGRSRRARPSEYVAHEPVPIDSPQPVAIGAA